MEEAGRARRARAARHGAARSAGLSPEPHRRLARSPAGGARAAALDVANTHLVVEHEYPKARIQDKERLKPILQGSIAFVRHIDEAAACRVRSSVVRGATSNPKVSRFERRGERCCASAESQRLLSSSREPLPWELGVGWWLGSGVVVAFALMAAPWCGLLRGVPAAEGETEPARHRVAAHRRHDHHRRIQPPRRARPRAVRQAGAVRPDLVPMRRRCDDGRGVDGVTIEGKELPAGRYSLWTDPRRSAGR